MYIRSGGLLCIDNKFKVKQNLQVFPSNSWMRNIFIGRVITYGMFELTKIVSTWASGIDWIHIILDFLFIKFEKRRIQKKKKLAMERKEFVQYQP